jgi:hypothetical protein
MQRYLYLRANIDTSEITRNVFYEIRAGFQCPSNRVSLRARMTFDEFQDVKQQPSGNRN